jgi:hypothetical protein
MNWGQNKFIIGFGAVMLVGCGTLGALLWQAGSQFSDLTDDYHNQVAQLQGLQNQPLYPEQGNLEKLEVQKVAAMKDATAFQAQVTPMAFPLETISPEQFQDKLRATVSSVTAKAVSAGVKVPDKFYLGFDDYQGKPPTVAAAPALNRELRAIELAANTLIESKVIALTGIKRDPLPEESKSKPGPKPSSLVAKFPFEIQFSSEQVPFRKALNALASNRNQLLVVRPLIIKNSVDKPISKAGNAQSSAGVPGAPDANGRLKFLVGAETLSVTLGIEMIVFSNPVAK